MSENILVKTIGGPRDGETRVVDRGVVNWDWPPPGQICVPGEKGFYRRESFSNLPSEPRNPNLMRGAQYKWVKDYNGECEDEDASN